MFFVTLKLQTTHKIYCYILFLGGRGGFLVPQKCTYNYKPFCWNIYRLGKPVGLNLVSDFRNYGWSPKGSFRYADQKS